MDVDDGVRPVGECRVCTGSSWQQILSFGALPLANGFLDPAESYDDEPRYPLGVMSCRSCGLLSLTHVVDPALLFRDYHYVISDSQLIRRHMRYVADTCRERFGLPEDSLVVEIGSNTGVQLSLFRAAGLRTLGVDPARNLVATAASNGVETWPEFFSPSVARRIVGEHGRARVLLGRHVLAHIDDLAGALAGVREVLAQDGVLVVEVPYLMDLLDNVAFDTIYHEHLSYFSVGTIDILFERHGLTVFDVERVAVHGGSILVFAGHAEGPWRRRRSVGELRRAEERARPGAYGSFTRDVARISQELPSLVRRLVRGGARVAGYGAPAKGNTLLNICGLGAAELLFCTDTTELKQGKMVPGVHVPVRDPAFAATHPPDYFLLLAWNYADEIISKEAEFLARGGKFILPVPEPIIVSAGSSAALGASRAVLT